MRSLQSTLDDREQLAKTVGIDLAVDDAASRWLVALAASRRLWQRNPFFEELRAGQRRPGGIPAPDAFRAEVSATRHIAELLCAGVWDWDTIATTLTDKARPVGGCRLDELVGSHNVAHLRRAARTQATTLSAISQSAGAEMTRVYLLFEGASATSYGVPWWPHHIEAFVDSLASIGARIGAAPALPGPELGADLVLAPDRLPAAALEWCLGPGRLDELDPAEGKRRWERAGSPRWAPPGRPAEVL